MGIGLLEWIVLFLVSSLCLKRSEVVRLFYIMRHWKEMALSWLERRGLNHGVVYDFSYFFKQEIDVSEKKVEECDQSHEAMRIMMLRHYIGLRKNSDKDSSG